MDSVVPPGLADDFRRQPSDKSQGYYGSAAARSTANLLWPQDEIGWSSSVSRRGVPGPPAAKELTKTTTGGSLCAAAASTTLRPIHSCAVIPIA